MLISLLGNDATVLISDWAYRVDFSKSAPLRNQAVLFVDSNNKDRPAQAKDFKTAGLKFGDDLQATIVCAALVNKAKTAGLDLTRGSDSWNREALTNEEFDLLSKLRLGAVRTSCGALFVDADGRLRAYDYLDHSHPSSWAFGGGSSELNS